MSDASIRPFHPIDFAQRPATLFAIPGLIDQLRQEAAGRHAKRDALTLIHDENLTAVLTVARAGAECEEHFSQEPTLFIVLEGELAIESASDGGSIGLRAGSAGALARDVRHRVTASTDCAYLLVMGCQSRATQSAEVRRPTVTAAPDLQPVPLAASSGAEPDAVEGLVHQLTHSIDAAPPPEREELRAYATDLLAADISSARAQAEERERSRRVAPFTVAGVALLMILAGAIFFPLLPAVAVLLILSALGIGVGDMVFTNRVLRRQRRATQRGAVAVGLRSRALPRS
jgi:quercetin dioxygenase-like cupin family protein